MAKLKLLIIVLNGLLLHIIKEIYIPNIIVFTKSHASYAHSCFLLLRNRLNIEAEEKSFVGPEAHSLLSMKHFDIYNFVAVSKLGCSNGSLRNIELSAVYDLHHGHLSGEKKSVEIKI